MQILGAGHLDDTEVLSGSFIPPPSTEFALGWCAELEHPRSIKLASQWNNGTWQGQRYAHSHPNTKLAGVGGITEYEGGGAGLDRDQQTLGPHSQMRVGLSNPSVFGLLPLAIALSGFGVAAFSDLLPVPY
jgi:hypothetical protein